MPQPSDILRFEGFALDRANRVLSREGRPIELGSRYFDALCLLVEEAGALVPKERFMAQVWRGIPVTDEALTQCIRTLRRALGDDAAAPRFIATVPKHGYRFLAPVQGAGDAAAAATDPSPPSVAATGRIAGAATVAGALAGALGGVFYAAVAATGAPDARMSFALVLIALAAALGVLGGAGVGLGMAAAHALRGRADASLAAGGALGGMAAGALGQLLSLDGLSLLTGQRLGPVTGLFEGLVLGLAAGLAGWRVLRPGRSVRRSLPVIAGIAIGIAAGALIAALGGKLLGGSLVLLAARFPASHLAMDRVGALFGETGFGALTNILTAAGEAGLFIGAIALALTLLRRAAPK